VWDGTVRRLRTCDTRPHFHCFHRGANGTANHWIIGTSELLTKGRPTMTRVLLTVPEYHRLTGQTDMTFVTKFDDIRHFRRQADRLYHVGTHTGRDRC